jgi:hypothetical protein
VLRTAVRLTYEALGFSIHTEQIHNMKQKLSEIAQRAKASASESMCDAGNAVKMAGTSVAEATGANLKHGAQRTIQAINDASDVLWQGARTSIDATKSAASSLGKAASATADATGTAMAAVAATTRQTASTVATTVLDQNGDGKLDQEDVRIFTEKGIALAKIGGLEAAKAAKSIASSDLVKESAAAAAVGAAIAIPVPIIGPATGALIGGATGAYLHLKNKNKK